MRFNDGGYGFLRPVTLRAGQWVGVSGAANAWQSKGGRARPSSGIGYAAMLACHPGASVTSVEIINDSGWLHTGPFRAEIDDIVYGGEVVSKPAPPVLGRSVNVARASGSVTVRLPQGAGSARASQGQVSTATAWTARSRACRSEVRSMHGAARSSSHRRGESGGGSPEGSAAESSPSVRRERGGARD